MANPSHDLDLDAIRIELEERRDRTRERLAELAKRPERGSALGFGKQVGDGTTEAVSRLTDIGVGDSQERMLARTERALAKLNDGSYGICDACGDPIPAGRRRALPDGVLSHVRGVRAPRTGSAPPIRVRLSSALPLSSAVLVVL